MWACFNAMAMPPNEIYPTSTHNYYTTFTTVECNVGTHTSVALMDAIKGTQMPTIELHLSNVHAREAFRHHSYISPVAIGVIAGFGAKGYTLAIDALLGHLEG